MTDQIEPDDVQERLILRRSREVRATREQAWLDFLGTDDAKMRVEGILKSLDKMTLEALRDSSDGEERFGVYMRLLTKGWFEQDGSPIEDPNMSRDDKIMHQIFWERCWSIFDDQRGVFDELAKPLGMQSDDHYYKGVADFVDGAPSGSSPNL